MNRRPGRRPLRFAASALWTPKSISNLEVWFRADASDITIATGVSQWNDRSGNGRNLTQGTAGLQPAYNATDAAYGNKPTVQSTATTMFLKTAAFAVSQPLTIVLIGESGTSSGTLAATSTSAATDPILFNSGGNSAINAGATLSSGIAEANPHADLALFNGASSFIGCSNWLTGGTSGNAGTGNAVAFSLFAYTSGDFGSVGKVAEVMMYSKALSAAEKTTLAAYITGRYGIAIT